MEIVSNEDIILENIKNLVARKDAFSEKISFHLEEYAREQNEDTQADAFLRLLVLFDKQPELLLAYLKLCYSLFYHKEESEEEFVCEKICYFKNYYTDNAFSSFKGIFPNAKGENVRSYEESIKALIFDKCDGCILPISSSTEDILPSFLGILYDNNLSISAVCEVQNTDGQRSTKYALVSKNGRELQEDDEVYSFLLPKENANLLPLIFDLVKEAKMSVNSLHTFPFGIYVSVLNDKSNFDFLEFSLNIICPTYHKFGSYRQMRERK